MSSTLEFAELLLTEEGALAVRLPWRHYPGLLIDAKAIAAAQELAQYIASELYGEEVDGSRMEDMADTLTRAQALLASPLSDSLRASPDAPMGKATCVRPAQLARPHDHQQVFVVTHLDTLGSFVGGIRSALQETNSPITRKALSDLLFITEGWYSLLRDAS